MKKLVTELKSLTHRFVQGEFIFDYLLFILIIYSMSIDIISMQIYSNQEAIEFLENAICLVVNFYHVIELIDSWIQGAYRKVFISYRCSLLELRFACVSLALLFSSCLNLLPTSFMAKTKCLVLELSPASGALLGTHTHSIIELL